MARTNNLSNFLTDVAAAIKTKKGDNTPIPANTFDTEIENLGGGDVVNGIIEQYKAESGTIDANTFVEFVNQYDFTVDTDTQLGGGTDRILALALSDNKVFIVHSTYNSSGGYYSLYGIVCTISGTTITAGTDTQLSSNNYAGYSISAVVLSEDKVFIAHNYGYNNLVHYLYGIVCTIDGITITKGTDTSLSTDDKSAESISAVKLSENKVFIAHKYSSSGYLYGIVCDISGTTITAGTDKSIIENNASYRISAVVLSDSKVFIAHSGGSNTYLYGIVCTISGTTITAGTDTQLNGSGYVISAVKLSDNKVFIAHSTGSSSYLYGIICTIDGTTIAKGSDTQLTLTTNTGSVISAAALSNKKVFIVHNYGSSGYLYGIICTISGTSITAGTDTQILSTTNTGNTISTVALSGNKVFIAHSGSYLYGIITNLPEITIQPSTSNIQGLTKDECTTSTAGDVWVLDN